MSAGRGVLHSEYNESSDREVHLLQIWIMPNVYGIEPSYEEKRFADDDKRGRLRLVASPDGRDGSVTIHADAELRIGRFDGDERATFRVPDGRLAYLHVARGSVTAGGIALEAGRRAEGLATPASSRSRPGATPRSCCSTSPPDVAAAGGAVDDRVAATAARAR